jgi:hypothetical protein
MDDDGGLTLYVQNESPGTGKEANWLPAPKGPFWVILRLYVPKPEALEGKWFAPPMKRLRHVLAARRLENAGSYSRTSESSPGQVPSVLGPGRVPPLTFLPRPTSAAQSPLELSA